MYIKFKSIKQIWLCLIPFPQQGLSWANVGRGVSAVDMFTMSDVMGTMLLTMFIFALLGW